MTTPAYATYADAVADGWRRGSPDIVDYRKFRILAVWHNSNLKIRIRSYSGRGPRGMDFTWIAVRRSECPARSVIRIDNTDNPAGPLQWAYRHADFLESVSFCRRLIDWHLDGGARPQFGGVLVGDDELIPISDEPDHWRNSKWPLWLNART